MNIGLFSDSYAPEISGVVSSMQTLRESLENMGHHVYVFTSAKPGVPVVPGVFRLPSMPFIFLRSMRFALFYTPRAARTVRKVHLDVIHTQTEFGLGHFGKLMAFTLQIPVVHTYHTMYKDYAHYVTKGHFESGSNALVKVLTRAYCDGFRAIVVPTQKVADLLTEYGVKRPLRVVPTGIDLSRFQAIQNKTATRDKIRSDYGLVKETPLIVCIGRVAKEKSIDMILHALPTVLKTIPGAKFLLVGDGPEREILESLVSDLDLRDVVFFAGSRPWSEIPAYYAAADVFVTASKTETQGLTVLEAMASGIPVLARNDISFSSFIMSGQSGFLFDNVDMLAEQIKKTLTDEQLAKALVQSGLSVVENFSAEVFGKRILEVYEEAMHMAPMTSDIHSFRVVGKMNQLRGRLTGTFSKQIRRNKLNLKRMKNRIGKLSQKQDAILKTLRIEHFSMHRLKEFAKRKKSDE